MASELIAYCGLYCGACSFKVAFEENDRVHLTDMPEHYDRYKNDALEDCPGCRLENKCGQCAIRDCAIGRGLDYCAQCNDFPCERSMGFNNDGRPHHGETISNSELLKEMGEERWLELLKEKWTCGCGARFSWYHNTCTKCGGK